MSNKVLGRRVWRYQRGNQIWRYPKSKFRKAKDRKHNEQNKKVKGKSNVLQIITP